MRQRIYLLTFMFAVLTLIQCGGNEQPVSPLETQSSAENTSGQKSYVLAFCPKMLDNPVFNLAKIAAEKTAKELEPKYGKIQILWSAPTEGDADKQVQIIQGFINRRVDGIAVSCNEPTALMPAINAATDAGISTMTFDSDSPESKRLTYYGTNDYECGQIIAERLHNAMGGQGTYAILTGVAGAYNLEERMRGIEEKLKEMNSGLQLLQKVYCEDDIAKSVQLIEQFMRAHPDLGGWAMVGGWPLFTNNALAPIDPPGNCKVVAVDTLPEMWPYIEKGYVEALIGQKIYHWGAESVRILMDSIVNGKQFPKNSWSGVHIVTKDNLEEYKKQWNEWFSETAQ